MQKPPFNGGFFVLKYDYEFLSDSIISALRIFRAEPIELIKSTKSSMTDIAAILIKLSFTGITVTL